MKQQTNLKELIAEAGFKNPAEFARYCEVEYMTVYNWCKDPPRRVVRELNSIIRGHRLEKENMKLLSDLNTIKQWMHPES